ncbi:hypothetical protein [Paenibacillus sp. 32O-W]|uniref:hypothetical protein n=1 Tax=Paenibacillus sp. 32O-W TaxID=1695218 RepID=UPI0011AEBA7A|nr:hypothetical protein [Paenibacillus sp. 32O-W]
MDAAGGGAGATAGGNGRGHGQGLRPGDVGQVVPCLADHAMLDRLCRPCDANKVMPGLVVSIR